MYNLYAFDQLYPRLPFVMHLVQDGATGICGIPIEWGGKNTMFQVDLDDVKLNGSHYVFCTACVMKLLEKESV